MSTRVSEIGPVPKEWTRRHLLDLESLSAVEIQCVLDTAARFKQLSAGCEQKLPALSGKTIANLFFENSTRTRTSFSLAARRSGRPRSIFRPRAAASPRASRSSIPAINHSGDGHRSGGDSASDSRHAHLLSDNLRVSVINAGDGPHEHPTQGLLDILPFVIAAARLPV